MSNLVTEKRSETFQKLGAIGFGIMVVWLLGSVNADACTKSEIRILQADHRPTDGMFAHVVGELVNDCDDATGVALRVTLRDQDGKVITSQKVWPASVANIPAHSSYPFEFPIAELRQNPPPTLQVAVEEVSKW
jgi:hypothetical protein